MVRHAMLQNTTTGISWGNAVLGVFSREICPEGVTQTNWFIYGPLGWPPPYSAHHAVGTYSPDVDLGSGTCNAMASCSALQSQATHNQSVRGIPGNHAVVGDRVYFTARSRSTGPVPPALAL